MTNEEAINVINTWIEPMRKTITGTLTHEFLDAVDTLRKQAISDKTSDKYAWHDLRKNPDDLPSGKWDEKLLCVIDSPIRFFRKYRICHYVRGDFLDFYSDLNATNKLEFQIVVAWREIEPFE